MKITALAGGVGGARFVRGLLDVLRAEPQTHGRAAHGAASPHDGVPREPAPPSEVTVVVNTGDDATMHGLRISPDVDTMLYTLGGAVHEEQGWGRREEAFSVATELRAYAAAYGDGSAEGVNGPATTGSTAGGDWASAWFTLGDRDLATHVVRTQLLRSGLTMSQVVERLAARWQPGARLLPMSDDVAETHVHLVDGTTVHFQEWWVRLRASVAATGFSAHDADGGPSAARPAPGVLQAITSADLVLLPPSNPVVSIGTVLALPGVREALAATTAPVVGVSPILGGHAVRGMADACLSAVGVPTTAAAVGGMYADVLDAWLVDAASDGHLEGTRVPGGRAPVLARPLLMRDRAGAAALAREALAVAADLLGPPA